MSMVPNARRPRIGVPAMWSESVNGLRYSGSVVANAVLESIVRAGGQPVMIFPGADFHDWDLLDGLVLPGGSDIAPGRYGQEPGPHLSVSDYSGQDDADARAIRAAEALGIPALLICRGMQLWNVERGGSLIQHWPREPQQHVSTVHDVAITPGTLLSHALQGSTSTDVSSYHHQAVGALGEGLRVVSRAGDGCVEALEDPEHQIIAVQWHPEDRAHHHPGDHALFAWIVSAAEDQRRTARHTMPTHQEVP
ncbi:gamma-glutamyl-gamma-aminobutyrate hydrolase family protein [Nesterenkonia sphaerica]|uniref:Gamma-glutamyl-gamma-aminobutyrate hydrolase family protein n=1 Tax=Nesterenkonia sphaerica TaxID=1804988 RepID=A0A5R9AJS0_9MICC|nr:gamma-glutamyl-gamma-aminobutyrate hydrolase family protein [Nesterenkonia sphaerica]TLP78838.1 gamma-glutamyl-gamma-aminobutyrate hydrolase family protein [Nesterenkonia sphaerica]